MNRKTLAFLGGLAAAFPVSVLLAVVWRWLGG